MRIAFVQVALLMGALIAVAPASLRAADEGAGKKHASGATTKASIPDAASVAAAERQIQSLVGKDLRSTSPIVRQQAAAKLLAQAQSAAGVAERFAMLKNARQSAAFAGDAEGAFAAVRQTVAGFDVDGRPLRAETILTLAKSSQALFDAEVTLNEALALMIDAVRADDYPAAVSIANEMKPLTDRLKLSDSAAAFAAEAKRVRELAGEYAAVSHAMKKLKTTPDDAAANGLVGAFECFRKRDWKSGLPLLARANDLRVRALAAVELNTEAAGGSTVAGPANVIYALKVADGWWDYSLTQPELRKSAVVAHAGDWYAIAAPMVGGMRKVGVQERIAAAAKVQSGIATSLPPRWVLLFRSDDASIWNHPAGTRIDHNGFAADAASMAPADTAYLRLRRLDTGEYVIVPMKKEDLHRQGPIWCGTAGVMYGGVHLGIKNPKSQNVVKGLVGIDGNTNGWGFGYMMYSTDVDARGHTWDGVTIGRTVFEIAVTADELSISERRVLLDLK